jgi:LysR family hydrogen peroxide-inducible transcriptional activator
MRSSPHPFTLRQLQYAAAVADLRSFRRAAERCHVSQPSLSAQVIHLEEALGVRLFERGSRRVLVTAAGEAVLSRVRRLLLEAEDLADSVRQLGDPLSGTLRLGVIPTISPYLLPEVVPGLRARHPGLSAVWVEDKTENLLESLREGRLDGALLALEAPIGEVEKEVVCEDPFVLAAPPGHPLVQSSIPATPQELRGAGFLLLDDGHCFRDQALAYCASARGRELDFRATSLATLAQMVAGGAGVTCRLRTGVPSWRCGAWPAPCPIEPWRWSGAPGPPSGRPCACSPGRSGKPARAPRRGSRARSAGSRPLPPGSARAPRLL